ncbi:glutathione S-transferase [Dongia soli]|uniref:Glutathione S-transferase n=1 Tax=Dongia soli TaxID=600628 RepID=A0ABU5E515_9PROT|nr:glutathione S-transferase [Dongia soli]MDY0881367.1 glutathione S-transferase [Dongia soli]
MKLRFSTTSPFARKARVVALETGQEAALELVKTVTTDSASGLAQDNPLSKIPVLILDNGEKLYDSPVICEYLDNCHKGAPLFPMAGPRRWTALRRQALADGMMDAAVLRMYERRRPENLRSSDWDAAQKARVTRGLAAFEAEAGQLGEQPDIGNLTVAILLDYLDFRFSDENWRNGHPHLAAWHKSFSARPSLASTRPHD